ncbi:MAG: hypothetical protein WA081_09790 [Desulfosalsimonadaceae bacterium]
MTAPGIFSALAGVEPSRGYGPDTPTDGHNPHENHIREQSRIRITALRKAEARLRSAKSELEAARLNVRQLREDGKPPERIEAARALTAEKARALSECARLVEALSLPPN